VLYIRRCKQGQPVSVALLCCQGGGLGIYLNLRFGLWLNWTVKRREEIMGKNYRGRITVSTLRNYEMLMDRNLRG